MKLNHHLKFGNELLNINNIKSRAFLIGCVLPDLNCVYPPHNLRSTSKRFKKKLRKVLEHRNYSIMNMIRAGECMHYACDYFCYAHNNHSYGLRHKKYETEYYKYYSSTDKNDINIEKTINFLIDYKSSNTCDIALDKTEKDILEIIYAAHKYYMIVSDKINKDENFVKNYKQYIIDTTFRNEVSVYILRLIIKYINTMQSELNTELN